MTANLCRSLFDGIRDVNTHHQAGPATWDISRRRKLTRCFCCCIYIILGVTILFSPQQVFGQKSPPPPKTVYPTAMVNLRSAPGPEQPRVRIAHPGSPLKVLSQQEEWYQVELEDGVVAWVYKGIVSETPPLTVKLALVDSKLKDRENELAETKQRLQAHLALNQRLGKDLGQKKIELEALIRQNSELKEAQELRRVYIGVGLLLLGWLLGLFTSLFRRRAK